MEAPDGGGGSSRYLTTFSPGAFEQIKRAGRDRGAWCTRERGGRGRLNVAQTKGAIRCGRLVVTERGVVVVVREEKDPEQV